MLVRGGNGGSGISCFHSEPRKEFGGPDGGDGGNGGHIILRGMCSGSSWGGDNKIASLAVGASTVLSCHAFAFTPDA